MQPITYWVVDRHQALTAQVKTKLLSDFGYVPDATHTYGAIVTVFEFDGGKTGVVTFPFTFVLTDYRVDGVADKAGDLEAAIDAACRARLLAARNAAPLASIVDRWHPL